MAKKIMIVPGAVVCGLLHLSLFCAFKCDATSPLVFFSPRSDVLSFRAEARAQSTLTPPPLRVAVREVRG